MKNLYILISIGFISLLLAGCGPQLARTNYGPEEQQWKDYVQKSYNGWEAPPTPAPYSENNVSQNATSSIDVVPAASVSEAPGTAETASTTVAAAPHEGTTYTVQKGDTLWLIAQKFYGNGNTWKVIKDANQDILGSSSILKAGMILKIPTAAK